MTLELQQALQRNLSYQDRAMLYGGWLDGHAIDYAGWKCDANSDLLYFDHALEAFRHRGRVFGNCPCYPALLRLACQKRKLPYTRLFHRHLDLDRTLPDPPDLVAMLRELVGMYDNVWKASDEYCRLKHRSWVELHRVFGIDCKLPTWKSFTNWVAACRKLKD